MTITIKELPGLVERLRAVESSKPEFYNGNTTCWHRNPDGPEAADTLESLAAEIERLREALEPFARAAELFDYGPPTDGYDPLIYGPAAGTKFHIFASHLHTARKALGGSEG
jgi:hypothetical protein